MSANSFVDTNILVYAYDRSAGEKHDLAKTLIETLWNDNTGIISTQVLQEFYVNVRRKVQSPLSATEARKLIEDKYSELLRITYDLQEELQSYKKVVMPFKT